jgi:hypothetical protein
MKPKEKLEVLRRAREIKQIEEGGACPRFFTVM